MVTLIILYTIILQISLSIPRFCPKLEMLDIVCPGK